MIFLIIKKKKIKIVNALSLILSLIKSIDCLIDLIKINKSRKLVMKKMEYSFSDLTVIDDLGLKNRYKVISVFINLINKNRLFYIEEVKSYAPIVEESISSQFIAALPAERESYDMFGIVFKHNLDLRRILTDYGFKGYPLKKDFPLSGFVQTIYSTFKKALKFRRIILAQEFRNFDYLLPWIYIKKTDI